MIIFIVYAIGVWAAVYWLRGKWQGPALLAASVIPVGLLAVLLVLPTIDQKSHDIIFANIGGYGRLLGVFLGAFGFLILFVGSIILVTPRRIPVWRCMHCQYDLTGAPSDVCPECGGLASAI